MLFGAAALPVATAFLSRIAGQITTTQEISVVALGAVVAGATDAYRGNSDEAGFLLTLLIAIGLTTLATGVFMFTLGAARLGRMIRYVPFPVFGGFLAITGWYLLSGGLDTAFGFHLTFATLAALTNSANLLKLGLVVAFVAIVESFNSRFPSGLFLPAAVSGVILLFNLVVLWTGVSHLELQRLGWIIAVPASGISWPPVTLAAVNGIEWQAVGAGLAYAPFVVLVTTAAAMMNVSGIEIELNGDIDLDGELRSMGVGNIAAGLVGGIAGFPGVSSTLLAVRMGAAEAATGVAAGAVTLTALAFAQQLLGVVPAPLLGALLAWLGMSLLIDWVIKPLRTLQRREHAIILLILAVSIVAGSRPG